MFSAQHFTYELNTFVIPLCHKCHSILNNLIEFCVHYFIYLLAIVRKKSKYQPKIREKMYNDTEKVFEALHEINLLHQC